MRSPGDPLRSAVLPGRAVGLQRQREGTLRPVLLGLRFGPAALPEPLPAGSVPSGPARSGSG